MRSILLTVLCWLMLRMLMNGQSAFTQMTYPAQADGKNLAFPFAGGLNAPQFSTADLNKDGWQDLVVFDRFGNRFLTFLNKKIPGTAAAETYYTYAPENEKHFPELKNWALLRDFDRDGAADIFCSSLPVGTFEIQVFKGYYDGNVLKFKPFKFWYPGCNTCQRDFIYYPDEIPGIWNNLSVSSEDIPAFDDIDNDGDLDLLTFEASVGGHIWYFENQSVERGFGADSLHFKLDDRCWGKFYESGQIACMNVLSPRRDSCVYGLHAAEDRNERHPGSTVTTYDADGDGDKELILGDVSFPCLNQMINSGTPQQAWMTAQDSRFPKDNVPVDLITFPAAFIVDVDNDGIRDMLVSPNARGIIEDQRNVWWYKNTGSNALFNFKLQKTNFLTEEMLDFGTVTHPAIADVDADGLLDIVVGTQGFFTPGTAFNARLYLLKNVGTAQSPAFRVVDKDWLGMSKYAPLDYDFSPAFGDLDSDNDLDLLIGSQYGAIYFFQNTGGANQPMQFQQSFETFWLDMDVGQISTPCVYDADGDGLPDLLMGERSGNINFFRNKGTATKPLFDTKPTIERWGNMDARYPLLFDQVGNSNISMVTTPSEGLLAVVGTFQGKLKAYRLTTDPTFPLVSDFWGQVDVGARSHPAFADFNGDGRLEMVVGNLRGGLEIYQSSAVLVDAQQPHNSAFVLTLAPNPARESIRATFDWNGNFDWQVWNMLGQVQAAGSGHGAQLECDMHQWASGLYTLELRCNGRTFFAKFLKI